MRNIDMIIDSFSPDLSDDALVGSAGLDDWDDWRTHVPIAVLETWPNLGPMERKLVFVCANSVTAWRDPMPLVVGIECYEFFGEGVKIVEVNIYDEARNAEVVIESRSMDQKRVDFQELSWISNPRLNSAACKRSQNEVIVLGTAGL